MPHHTSIRMAWPSSIQTKFKGCLMWTSSLNTDKILEASPGVKAIISKGGSHIHVHKWLFFIILTSDTFAFCHRTPCSTSFSSSMFGLSFSYLFKSHLCHCNTSDTQTGCVCFMVTPAVQIDSTRGIVFMEVELLVRLPLRLVNNWKRSDIRHTIHLRFLNSITYK